MIKHLTKEESVSTAGCQSPPAKRTCPDLQVRPGYNAGSVCINELLYIHNCYNSSEETNVDQYPFIKKICFVVVSAGFCLVLFIWNNLLINHLAGEAEREIEESPPYTSGMSQIPPRSIVLSCTYLVYFSWNISSLCYACIKDAVLQGFHS